MAELAHSRIANRVCRDVAELPDRTSPNDWPEAMLVTSEELHAIVVEALSLETLVVDLGVGLYRVGGDPAELPPRIHFYAQPHDQPIGADVPQELRTGEPALTLVFHNREAHAAFKRALELTETWFPQPPIDIRMVT